VDHTAKTNASLTVLNLLTPERQREILDEAIGTEVRRLLEKHHSSTLGDLVAELSAHPLWEVLRAAPVSFVFATPAKSATANANANGSNGHRATSPEPKPKANGKRSIPSEPVDAILQVVRENPGLRSEDIRKKLPAALAARVKLLLRTLRDEKRVRTDGIKRQMVYFVA
jgi:hypothetical protein